MASIDELASIANSSAFIFSAKILGPASAAAHTDDRTVAVLVGDVIKAPAGMGGLAGRDVTMHLRDPLSEETFVLVADPVSVDGTIPVRETADLDAERRGEAEAAMERGDGARLAPRLGAASLAHLSGGTGVEGQAHDA
jgi:hypothetical protein